MQLITNKNGRKKIIDLRHGDPLALAVGGMALPIFSTNVLHFFQTYK